MSAQLGEEGGLAKTEYFLRNFVLVDLPPSSGKPTNVGSENENDICKLNVQVCIISDECISCKPTRKDFHSLFLFIRNHLIRNSALGPSKINETQGLDPNYLRNIEHFVIEKYCL